MYKTFTLPLKSAFSLAAFFILTACGGFTIDLDSLVGSGNCLANPFEAECDNDKGIAEYRRLIAEDCNANPEKANTVICTAAAGAANPSSDNENGATGAVAAGGDNTPKKTEVKIEFDKNSLTKTDKEKSENTGLEIVDLCTNPATAGDKQCTLAVVNCINNPFSGSCQGDNLLGNFVRDGVTVSKTVILQDKRAEDCRTGRIDRALCQNLSVQKQRCAGAAFSTDVICTSVANSVCKADAFDPLCGEKEDFQGAYFSERSYVCYEDPNNPNCKGANGHVAVVCSEYPFDRLCTGNADYDDARANACEANPSVSSDCPAVPVVDVCLDNPFGPTCADSSYNNARKDLAKTCAIQAVTGAVTSACDTIIAEALPCFINPFDTVCDSNPAVRSYIAELRSSRVAFCKNSTGLLDHLIAPLCTGAPVAKSVCRIDPFNTACLGDNDYDNSRLSACRDDSSNQQCGNIIAGVCRDNPFDSLCGSGYTNARLSACRDDSSNQQCGNIIAGVCRDNPFDALCGSGYTNARLSACRDGSASSGQCGNIIRGVCGNNPFDSLCGYGYTNARLSACRNGWASSGQCGNIITRVCRNNPFDTLCGSSYDKNREGACYSNPNSSRCRDTLARVCGGNPFNRLCRNTQSYLNTRVSICRGNPLDGRCGGTISGICNDDPFDTVCPESGWNNARETACRNGSTNTQCGGIIAGVCRDNPFDTMCGGGYTNARLSTCRSRRESGGPTTLQCRSIIAGVCRDDPFDTMCGSGYTQNRRSLCTDNPFAPRCAGEGYNDLRVSFCENDTTDHPSCPRPEPTTPQVTAEVWADSFDEDLSHGVTAEDTESQFLIGRETDLDTGGRRPYSTRSGYNDGLNLADATFNGVALGGDAADGVAFFSAEAANNGRYYSYAGILEGTNLGAPLTDTTGSAKWIGSFKYENRSATDFVLNVSFGTGAGAGEIEAIIQTRRSWNFHIAGEFDDAGVITGRARSGLFTPSDPDNSGSYIYQEGELTGLIGEEGAVGAFLLRNSFGGFVARPTSTDELRTLEQTCTDDPFNKGCTIGYESARNEILEHCIIGGNANDERCDSVNESYACINNPFYNWCDVILPDHYERARANRVAFCRTVGNAGNALCTVEKTFAHICTNYPFDAQCLSNNRFTPLRRSACTDDPFAQRCAGEGYNDLRVSFCEGKVGTHSSCPAPEPTTPQVTATVWADSFDEDLAHGVTADDTESQFLIARATDLDTGGRRTLYRNSSNHSGNLNLADATFNGVALGGDAADGAAFFAAERANNGRYYSYAGILEGTNLGAPLTDTIGSAKWIGSFQVEGRSPTDFVLNILFGTGAGAGEIEALVQRYTNFDDYHLKGEFDDAGVITGKVGRGYFRDRTDDPNNRGITGYSSKLTGLIGEEGAVGAFLLGNTFGGFVARPSSTDELQTLAQTCADDPFHNNCSVGYESERSDRIEYCITGSNSRNTALCGGLKRFNYCINNPFHIECESLLSQYYEQARANRVAFCRTAGNVGNGLCTVAGAYRHICTNHPFDAQCLGDDDYDQTRQDACTTAGTGSTECRLLAGINCSANPFHSYCDSRYNDARASACNANPGQQRCGDTVERVCNGNPFDSLCRNTTIYLNARKTQCRSAWNDPRCLSTIRSVCGSDPFDRMCGSGYTQSRRSLCTDNPFAPRCAGEGYNDLRVSFCGKAANAGNPDCPTPQVTASVWADSFDEDLAHGATAEDTESKFLIGRETDLDTGGVELSSGRQYSLNLADATFNGQSLGGDAADGVAFFTATRISNSGSLYSYAGILSGTNLGAPLTDTEGSAKWIGSFQHGRSSPTDFILNVSFGTGEGAGEIEAIVQNQLYSDYHVTGEFDDTGVITGTARYGLFRTNDPNNRGFALPAFTGKLTGLIGEEGAVGAFFINDHFGGFVARPSSADELRTLAQTCADDPFNKGCNVGYESERNARLDYCIIGGNANDASCRLAKELHPCIYNPFKSDRNCDSRLPNHYEQARINRVAFCRTAGNAENRLCTIWGTFNHVCTNHPFDTQCLGRVYYEPLRRSACTDTPFARRCADEGYNDLRVSFCEGKVGTHPSCPQPTPNRVTTADWLASFDTPLRTQSPIRHQNNGPRHWDQFLKSTASGLDTSGLEVLDLTSTSFANATFDGQSLGGDALGGVYSLRTYLNGLINGFASIHSDTDLGAPLTAAAGTKLIWHGAFQTTTRNYNGSTSGRGYDSHTQDFDLEINFGAGSKVGTVEAFVKNQTKGYDNLYKLLKGEFDANGVIDGTVKSGFFLNHDRLGIINNNSSRYSYATLSGLIGEKGAVGVFQGGAGSGGFIATPNARFNPNVRHSDWVNSFDAGALHNFASQDNYGNLAVFVRGDETGIHSRKNTIYNQNFAPTVLGNTLDFSDINPALDSADKVSYILTRPRYSDGGYFGDEGHAAGIWPTTDLGLPLEIRPADAHGNPHKATWGGKLGLIVNGKYSYGRASGLIPTRDIGLVVDYTNQTIHNTSTINGAHQIVLNGRWTNNADNSQNGVIDGDITYNAAPTDTDSTAYAGVVKGIIGQEGAVGAFVRDGTDFDYVGGFIAHPSVVFVPPAPQVTAKVWADSFDTPLATVASVDDTEHKFLIGRARYLDTDGVRPYRTNSDRNKNLTLADATFNGVALGGDAADGVAFFAAQANNYSSVHSYAGILSGTNLGAPLTDNTGSAKWIGAFQHGRYSSADFILNVSFGTGEGAGEIEAIVPTSVSADYHVAGEFDDAGVITGTVQYGFFRTNVPDNRGAAFPLPSFGFTSELTGLIGEEGAVGAFFISEYYGGFVARPSSAEELRTLAQTCADDPFNRLCAIGYESERNEVIEHCIIGGNANDESCDSVKGWHYCINDPFRNECYKYLPQHYEQARANRLAFCRTAGNAGNALCTVSTTFAHICTNHPFDAQCRGDNDYRPIRRDACLGNPFATRCGGDAYNDLRVTFCENNAGNPDCPQTPQVTASVWADSFDEDLAHAPTATDTESRFLIGRATDLNTGGRSPFNRSSPNYFGNLNLADATFNGVALGGDAEDGMAFFAAIKNPDSDKYYTYKYVYSSYAGLLSGTNLGAPLTNTIGSAKWVGSFQLESLSPVDFVLNISFGAGDEAGKIEALVQRYAYYDYRIAGEFDDAGVITGTARRGIYGTNDPDFDSGTNGAGKLTGLIGEQGAVGAFFIDNFFGGLVARPSSVAELRTLTQTCADDPFNALCAVGYESQRNEIIEHCIIGDNANDTTRCGSAKTLYDCINNPFDFSCSLSLPDHYQRAHDNRVAFCRTAGNVDNAICTLDTTFAYICTNHPFDAQCLGNTDYTPIRRTACTDNPFARRCAGDGYNDLRVGFCEKAENANNPSCPRSSVQTATSDRVTTADWLASFDEPLSRTPTSEDTESKFLVARATDLDRGGVSGLGWGYRHNDILTLASSTFNGRALGGDRADGVAFFAATRANDRRHHSYAGILSGTNLGAPLTYTQGTAKWVGSLQVERASPIDFVLNVSFGTGDGAGEIEAVARRGNVFSYSDYHIEGEFNDAGVITGTAWRGRFRANDPDKRGWASNKATLTGLIGEEGAVGAFLMDNYYSGFVARPSTADERRTLEQTCTDNPFDELCVIGYEAERNALVEHCITGGNANDAICDPAKEWYYCIDNPFVTCSYSFPNLYEKAQANRVVFCRTPGNAGNKLCTASNTFRHICWNYPFDPQCLGNRDFNEARQRVCSKVGLGSAECRTLTGIDCNTNPFHSYCGKAYNDFRVTFCGRAENANNPACPRPQPTPNRVTTEDWLASFDTPIVSVPTDYRHQFLQGSETGLNTGRIRIATRLGNSIPNHSKTFDDTVFDGEEFDGDATGGFAYFKGLNPSGGWVINYAGILAGTDLGAPLTETTGSARWNGVFLDQYGPRHHGDFTLIITFGGQEHAGTLHAYIQQNQLGEHLRVDGHFDNNGMIGGKVSKWWFHQRDYTALTNNIHGNRSDGYNAKLTGLIGQKGAAAVFVGDSLVGGFVASPDIALSPEVTERDWRESFNDKVLTMDGTRNDPGLGSFIQGGNKYNYPDIATRRTLLTIDGVPNTDDDEVGVRFYTALFNGQRRHYSGILKGTRLGNPLTVLPAVNGNPVTVTWSGQLGIIANNSAVSLRDMNLSVDFTNQTISHSSVLNTGRKSISLDGTWTDNGLIDGTITYDPNPVPNAVNARDGVVRGLIGQYGAIGAFISNDDVTDMPFAGGFVATPPSQ